MASFAVDALDATIVEVTTNTGLRGFGEVCPLGPIYQAEHALGARAALTEIAPHLIGLNPLHFGNILSQCHQVLMGHNYAKAAIEMALWDIIGKHYNAPLCDLLGGAKQTKIPSYYAIGVGLPEEVAERVLEKQAQGFSRLQIKIGGRSVTDDVAVVEKVFEVKNPDTTITLDANRALCTADTIRLSQSCADLDFILEQPCASNQELKTVKPNLCHPLYADETVTDLAMVSELIHEGVADGFGMKIGRIGGVSVMRSVIDLCHTYRKPLSCDDTWGGDLVAATCVHLGATIYPELLRGVWIAAPYIEQPYDANNSVQIKNGSIEVPKAPGLGVVPDVSLFKFLQEFKR